MSIHEKFTHQQDEQNAVAKVDKATADLGRNAPVGSFRYQQCAARGNTPIAADFSQQSVRPPSSSHSVDMSLFL